MKSVPNSVQEMHKTMKISTALLMFLIACQKCHAEKVSCPDLQETCECSRNAIDCEFTLRIEERFSFVSYEVNEASGTLGNRGTLYYMDNLGFHQRGKDNDKCTFNQVFYKEEQFGRRGCSMPITIDGNTYRTIITINGRIPGPTLVVHENQIVVVHVINRLPDAATSVHWHGLHQGKSVWMDGVGGITHPPIDPGSSFDYIFEANPPGTHWYHSHVGSQKGDGLFGAFIVCEKIPLHKILDDQTYQHVIDLFGNHTIAATDWQRKPEATHQALSGIRFFPNASLGVVPSPNHEPVTPKKGIDDSTQSPFPFWSALINGRGRRDDRSRPDDRSPYSIFHVGRGNLYHFRLIGSASAFAFNFSIDGHRLLAIGSDGYYFKPVEVDYIIIHSGETYDFLLDTTFDSTQSNYWIRAHTLEHNLPTDEEHSALAILTYADPKSIDWRSVDIGRMPRDCTANEQCAVLNCPYSSHPEHLCISLLTLERKPSNGLVEFNKLPKYPPDEHCSDCEHFLNFAFVGNRNSINGVSFVTPPLSYSTNCGQYSKGASNSAVKMCGSCSNFSSMLSKTEGVCECTNILQIASKGKYTSDSEPQSISLVISTLNSNFSHPIHLHGHSFYIVHTSNDSSDLECDDDSAGFCSKPRWRNGVRPKNINSRIEDGRITSKAIQKDTVVVEKNSYIVISFQADNPGYWFMHCHVEEHLLDGMALLIQEYNNSQHWKPPAGINDHGSFRWTVEDYKKNILASELCSTGKSIRAANFLVIVVAAAGVWRGLSIFIPLL